MQTGWRLERSYLAGAGFPESRLEGLDIAWSDPLKSTGHAALWADNGTGKTTVTALRYGLYLPHSRDFIRGGSDRSLAKLVRSGDVCHVVEQATRVVGDELQRIVVGMVADWPDGGTQDLENPSRLRRMFYGWLTGSAGPTVDDLPFRTDVGRWATRAQFVDAVRDILPDGGAGPPHSPSDHQGQWRRWLIAAGVDLDQIRFQTEMNASEGGVDRVMRFADSDAFVRWLIGATMSTSTVEQITNSIDVLRNNAAARPQWEEELSLWSRIIDPLLEVAIAHERVTDDRRAVETVEADAAVVVADADATIAALTEERDAAAEQLEYHDRHRRDATTSLRRAQAHRSRMGLRAAELRVEDAKTFAKQCEQTLNGAVDILAAWRLVDDVRLERAIASRLAGMEERRNAAEKQTEDLRHDEKRHRHALARLLTDRRDTAMKRLEAATAHLRSIKDELKTTEDELRSCVFDHGTEAQRVRQLRSQITESEQMIADAVTVGLLPEATDPAEYDAVLNKQVDASRKARGDAEAALKAIENCQGTEQTTLSTAQQQAESARNDAHNTELTLRSVNERVEKIVGDERLLDIVGTTDLDLWNQRTTLTDALSRRAAKADTAANTARNTMAAAQRVIDSVGNDGLLPPAALVEAAVSRCQDLDLPVWAGWRWLSDTMEPAAAERFATVRPDIAAGVVVSHPDLVDEAVGVIDGLDRDTALWVGAITNSDVAQSTGEWADGTFSRTLLPPPGTYNKGAVAEMVASATDTLAQAARNFEQAEQESSDTRAIRAALEQFWTDLPHDPRGALTEKIHTAQQRRREAETRLRQARAALDELAGKRADHKRARNTAQQTLDHARDTRVALAPTVSAAAALAKARRQLPAHRRAADDLQKRITRLSEQKADLDNQVAQAQESGRDRARAHDDAAEALREAGLSATTDGPVPADDDAAIRARIRSVEDAIKQTAIDPELHAEIERARREQADLNSRLDREPARRIRAEELADSDDARHPVAIAASLDLAQTREAEARSAHAKADAAVDSALREYRRRERDAGDRSFPDVEGFPAAAEVTDPTTADQVTYELDAIVTQLLDVQRSEERRAKMAEAIVERAHNSSKLVKTSADTLRHLTDPTVRGRRADDIDQLIAQIGAVSANDRQTRQALSESQEQLRAAVTSVRAHANGSHARAVDDRDDPRIAELIQRLRGDERLPFEAENIASNLEQRVATLCDDLDNHEQHVRTCARMLHVQAATALQRLRAYQNQSRLPDGLGDWSQRRFVVIDHDPIPADESVAVDRVVRVVHAQLTPGAGRTDAQVMLFAAARALVDAPFNVRVLKPHTDMTLDRVDVSELKNFSGGQRVTAGVLLYATMTRVRATSDAASIGWLWLDNPFGQASADQFVRTMRRAADKLGLQLVFTAAPKDKGALSMFDRIIELARRSRHSSREKVVVVNNGDREIVDLTLVQNDVATVLGA